MARVAYTRAVEAPAGCNRRKLGLVVCYGAMYVGSGKLSGSE